MITYIFFFSKWKITSNLFTNIDVSVYDILKTSLPPIKYVYFNTEFMKPHEKKKTEYAS